MGFHRCVLLGTLAAMAGSRMPAVGQEPNAPSGEKYALLVGVSQYDPGSSLKSLKYAESDMIGLREVLRAGGYQPGNVVLLSQTEGAKRTRFLPLGVNVRKELELLLRGRTAADSVIVAFAGHGVQFRNDQAYFCPADAQLDDKTTLISLREVYQLLERCPAGDKLLLCDACRDDPIDANTRTARAVVDLPSFSRPRGQPMGGVAALFSCSEGERAFENDTLKHGVFFHFVIQGLRGEADRDHDRRVDLDELARFARQRVMDFVRDKYGKPQTPFAESKSNSAFTLISVRAPIGPFDLMPGTPARPDVGAAKTDQIPPPPRRRERTSVATRVVAALPPQVHIASPREGASVGSKVMVHVEATPEDEEPVTRVRMFVNGRLAQGPPETSKQTRKAGLRVDQWLTLQRGPNVIMVEATNRAGKSARSQVAVNCDPYSGATAAPTLRPPPRAAATGQPPYLGLYRDPRFAFTTSGPILGTPDPGSPASKAGIQNQDMLVKFNRTSIKTWADYERALALCRPGDTVKLEVIRGGKHTFVLNATLTARRED